MPQRVGLLCYVAGRVILEPKPCADCICDAPEVAGTRLVAVSRDAVGGVLRAGQVAQEVVAVGRRVPQWVGDGRLQAEWGERYAAEAGDEESTPVDKLVRSSRGIA